LFDCIEFSNEYLFDCIEFSNEYLMLVSTKSFMNPTT
jgi:hypothetical protein